jgi:guanosine-diphosphatase
VYQPSLLQTFPTGPILLLSYFYDRLHPLLRARMQSTQSRTLTVAEIARTARRVCAGRAAWGAHWGDDADALFELGDRPEYCLDLTFQYALLRLGYEFADEREVRIEKKVDDTELGWCLGATISMLDGHVECRQ